MRIGYFRLVMDPRPAESERVRRIREELEDSIDEDLKGGHGGHPVQVDPNVLRKYAAYLEFSAAQTYRRVAGVLSAIVTASAVVSLVIAFVR